MSRKAYHNVINLSIIRFSKWFMLYMPVVKLFYEQNGLNNFQLFFLQAVHSLVITLIEIPSGYAADLWGRRNTIIIGTILDFAGFAIYSISSSFLGFLIAELVLGLGVSFVSGSDSAILYDTLADEGKERGYLKYEGRLSALGNFSESMAGITVSFIVLLGITNLRYAYIAQSFVALAGIPAAFLLAEPKMHIRQVSRNFYSILQIIRKDVIDIKELRYLIVLSSVIGFSTLIMAWYAQIFFFEVNLNMKLYGILWTALNVTVGLGSLAAFKAEGRLGMNKTNIVIIVFIAGIFFINGLIIKAWAISFLFVFYFVRGIATPTLKMYINRITPSDIRATVLSVRSLIIRILYSIMGPFFGWISDTIDLSTALIMTGITVLISGTLTLLFISKTARPINH